MQNLTNFGVLLQTGIDNDEEYIKVVRNRYSEDITVFKDRVKSILFVKRDWVKGGEGYRQTITTNPHPANKKVEWL